MVLPAHAGIRGLQVIETQSFIRVAGRRTTDAKRDERRNNTNRVSLPCDLFDSVETLFLANEGGGGARSVLQPRDDNGRRGLGTGGNLPQKFVDMPHQRWLRLPDGDRFA
jgi:hypothetical protein